MSSEGTPTSQGQPGVPNLQVVAQYVKDLSFEVPGAPQIFSQLKAQPQVSINLDVQARRVTEGQSVFEVAIVIRAEAHDNSPQADGQPASPPPTAQRPAPGTATRVGRNAPRAHEDAPALTSGLRRAGPSKHRSPSATSKQPTNQGGP